MSTKRFASRKTIAVLSGATAVILSAGVAFASWTANGTGSGYAKAKTGAGVSTEDISATATVTADLYPGADGNVYVKLINSNPYPIHVSQIAQDTDATTGNPKPITSSVGTCDSTTDPHTGNGVSFTTQTNSGAGWDVAAKVGGTNGFTPVTLANAAHMVNSSDTTCQGATFTIPLKIAAQSAATS